MAEKVFAPNDRQTPAISYPAGAAFAAALFIVYLVFLINRIKANHQPST